MERIGQKPTGLAGLQQKLLTKLENQVKAQAVSQQLQQTRTGFDVGQTSPLNLFPQAAAATSTAQTMSVRDAQRLQQLASLTQTRAVVDNMTRGLTPADKALIEGKVGELVADDRSIEKTTPQRFAANLALEISEHTFVIIAIQKRPVKSCQLVQRTLAFRKGTRLACFATHRHVTRFTPNVRLRFRRIEIVVVRIGSLVALIREKAIVVVPDSR